MGSAMFALRMLHHHVTAKNKKQHSRTAPAVSDNEYKTNEGEQGHRRAGKCDLGFMAHRIDDLQVHDKNETSNEGALLYTCHDILQG